MKPSDIEKALFEFVPLLKMNDFFHLQGTVERLVIHAVAEERLRVKNERPAERLPKPR